MCPQGTGQDRKSDEGGGFPGTHGAGWRPSATGLAPSATKRSISSWIGTAVLSCNFLQRRGLSRSESEDTVHDFLLKCLQDDLFAKANVDIGRFRNFLLKSLKNFLATPKRAPRERVSVTPRVASSAGRDLQQERPALAPLDTETPDEVFHRTWLRELVQRVLQALQAECVATGKQMHFELFRQRIVAPILDGDEAPSHRKLAEQYGMSEKEVANQLLTARRAYIACCGRRYGSTRPLTTRLRQKSRTCGGSCPSDVNPDAVRRQADTRTGPAAAIGEAEKRLLLWPTGPGVSFFIGLVQVSRPVRARLKLDRLV